MSLTNTLKPLSLFETENRCGRNNSSSSKVSEILYPIRVQSFLLFLSCLVVRLVHEHKTYMSSSMLFFPLLLLLLCLNLN
jgi:hypothetical protein